MAILSGKVADGTLEISSRGMGGIRQSIGRSARRKGFAPISEKVAAAPSRSIT
jgi:hypothetical protein